MITTVIIMQMNFMHTMIIIIVKTIKQKMRLRTDGKLMITVRLC